MKEHSFSRRRFLSLAAAGIATATTNSLFAQASGDAIQWHDVRDWGVEGKGWDESETEKYFDRLPARAQKSVREPVWNLSRHSAGMLVRFTTDAPAIWADYAVTSPSLAMPHMPATGVSGLDLYADDAAGNTRWVSVVRPTTQKIKTQLISGLIPGERVYTIYLPLYNGTEYLKVGVPKDAKFEPVAPRKDKPIVFYGTSITHGACASRPGMPHPAILGRRLKQPVINLGFSGNGRMEKEVGALLAELDPAVYVIDCLPNMLGPEVSERAEPLVRQLREARPQTPIVLVEDRTYSNTPFLADRQQRHRDSRAALRAAFENLTTDGFQRLYYLEGEKLLGEDHDDTTDGSHPSDLGFYRQANAFEPVLRKALKPS
jgi:lysophospholipase L1-like esterase